MFPGSPRRRDGVRIIPLGSVSQIVLCGDDPDFIVLEAFNTLFSGTTVSLPNDAPIGKVFKFALTTEVATNPSLSIEYVDVIVPLPKGVGVNNVWRIFSGQRPVFTQGPRGWLTDAGAFMSVVGSADWQDLAIGSHSNASGGGVAIGRIAVANAGGASLGLNSNSAISGAAVGQGSNGSNSGAAVGNSANGSASGVAVGMSANGSSGGIALGYSATTNSKSYAVALGYYAKAERYREFVKTADGASACKQSFSILDWYGDTTNATLTEIFLGAANQRAIVLASSAYMFKLLAVARDNVNNVVSAWEITGAIKRDAASNTALVGAVTTTLIAQDAAAATWAIAVTADDTNEALAIKVTGAAATTIRWNVRGDISELRF